MSFNNTGYIYIYTRLTPAKGHQSWTQYKGQAFTKVSQKYPIPQPSWYGFFFNVPNTKTSGYVQKLIPDQHWSKLTLGQSKP
jgi:hypothetical protein